jgi:hypothetical protein
MTEKDVNRASQKRQRKWPWALRALAAFLIVVLWILLVGGTRRNEMVVGSLVLLATGAFVFEIWKIETLKLEFGLEDVAQGWRIPWYILSGVYEIVAVLFQDLLGLKRSDSLYRVCGFKTSKLDPRLVARRVLATFYTTMAPNFIVIGIDYRQSRMLFHQLERSDVPEMTKELGAQPRGHRS